MTKYKDDTIKILKRKDNGNMGTTKRKQDSMDKK
jgi:hypothetical protein